jgi:hypothetical protein
MLDLETYKELEGIKSTDRDDQLERVIEGVNSIIKSYLGYNLTSLSGENGTVQYFDIQWDTYVVQLRYSPVISILGVWERPSRNEEYVELFSENVSPPAYDWYFDATSDAIFRTNEWGSYIKWPKGVGSVKVQYQAGYAVTPPAIVLAAVDLTNYYMKDEYKARFTVGSNTVEGASTSSLKDASFPDHIRRVLDMYRL